MAARPTTPLAVLGYIEGMAARPTTPLAVLGCLLAALLGSGCGADAEQPAAPLPPAAVAELNKQLGSIEQRFEFGDGACADIERDNRTAVRRTLARLPDSVDPDVRRALRQSFARLFELASRQCAKHKPPPTSTPATPTATTPAAPPRPTAPVTTETTPTDTTETTPTDTTDATPRTNTTKATPRPPSPDRTGTQPTTPPTTPNRSDTDSAESGGARAPRR